VASLRRRFPQPLQIIDPTTTTNKHHNLVSLQLGLRIALYLSNPQPCSSNKYASGVISFHPQTLIHSKIHHNSQS
jgi:hypothetical protein